MTPKEAKIFLQSRIELIDKYYPQVEDYREALEIAIKALGSWDKYSTELWQSAYECGKKEGKNEKCEDCISRERLLARIDEERKHLLDLKMDGAEHIIVHHARRIIEDMPSVTPQPKKGKWLNNPDADYGGGFFICSECGAELYEVGKYCSECGSDNRDLESLGESFADGYEDGLEEKA